MKRFTSVAVVFLFTVLISSVSFARGNYYGQGTNFSQHTNIADRYRQSRMQKMTNYDPTRLAYRSMVRASNELFVAKAYAPFVKNGKLIVKTARSYFEKAKLSYKREKYTKSAEFALSSSCLSGSIVHAYKAQHLEDLPQYPKK